MPIESIEIQEVFHNKNSLLLSCIVKTNGMGKSARPTHYSNRDNRAMKDMLLSGVRVDFDLFIIFTQYENLFKKYD